MIPQSVLIGLIAALIGHYFQQRAWWHKRREEVRQREFEECTKIIDSLARAVDKRLFATSNFIHHVNNNAANPDKLDEFQLEIKNWMHQFSSFKSKIFHFFGYKKMLEFENTVHGNLRAISDIILRTNKLGLNNLNKRDRQEHDKVNQSLDFARYQAYKFIRELNEMTANEQTERISLYNNIQAGKLDLISTTYLIQRLLGMQP